TGQQHSGAFTLTNRITGNQVTVSDVASMFSISPAGMMSQSAKPAAIAAIESAAFQALVPVMAAAANFGASTNQGNPTQSPDQNTHQTPNPTSNPSNSSGPASGGSSGANPGPQNASPDDNHTTTVPLTSTPPSGTSTTNASGPTTTTTTTTTTVVTTVPDTHIIPTATVTNVSEIETAAAQSGSFNLFTLVSVANAGSPTGYVNGSATL